MWSVLYSTVRVSPVLPATWPGYTATRRFRGATYSITVRRGQVGESRLLVGGELVAGTLVPLGAPGARVRVEVVLPPG